MVRMNFKARLFAVVKLLVVFAVVGTVVQLRFFRMPRRAAFKEPPPPAPVYRQRRIRPSVGDVFRIAIGGAISSKGVERLTPRTITKLPMFWVLFPSFCRTASPGYEYHFYFGYDYDDHMANATYRRAATDAFNRQMASCGSANVAQLHLVRCEYHGRPAWAQNDAMMAAYVDGMDFFFRLNDDTLLVTPGWTDAFVDELAGMAPAFVGAVGPYCDRGPRVKILTHDFVHRTHVDIFGYYYPRVFADWYADNWITHVYGRNVRARILEAVVVNHTESLGKRYKVRKIGRDMVRLVNVTAGKHRQIVDKYIEMVFLTGEPFPSVTNAKPKIISMTLYGANTKYTSGAIRNAQLMPVYYPNWTLRIYHHPKPNNLISGDRVYSHLYVPDNVIQTLRLLGAKLIPVNDKKLLRSPRSWRLLVFSEVPDAEFVLVCNADSKLAAWESLP